MDDVQLERLYINFKPSSIGTVIAFPSKKPIQWYYLLFCYSMILQLAAKSIISRKTALIKVCSSLASNQRDSSRQGRIILYARLSVITYNQASKKILCNDYLYFVVTDLDNDRHCKKDKECRTGFWSQNEDWRRSCRRKT